jgi:indolepyruvate ferredoxin oxidoreductase beta subunit
MNSKNILLVGVGGQGILTMGRILASSAIRRGVKALTSEIHGMAQRGGSVIVHVRMGDVESPLIGTGMADVMVGLEMMEVLRHIKYANRESIIIVNDRVIRPSTAKTIPTKNQIIAELERLKLKYVIVGALNLALKAGSEMAENMVLLGSLIATEILSEYIEITDLENTLKEMFKGKVLEVNLKALKYGYEAYKQNTLRGLS